MKLLKTNSTERYLQSAFRFLSRAGIPDCAHYKALGYIESHIDEPFKFVGVPVRCENGEIQIRKPYDGPRGELRFKPWETVWSMDLLASVSAKS